MIGGTLLSKKSRRVKAAKRINHDSYLTLVNGGTPLIKERKKEVKIVPRNRKQYQLLNLLRNKTNYITFATGPAGTGKTLISTLFALRSFKESTYERIVITRPAVSVDEQHGFLPGTLVEKMTPWTKPIMDVFEEYYSPKEIKHLLDENVVEIAPLAFMRGRTFKNAIIIADEMQNATDSQMKMLLTRIGEGSKLIITGDLEQHDRGYTDNGLKLFMERLSRNKSDMIGSVEFDFSEIERHPVVSEVLNLYET
jgi:phosphate starvation-inducible PhoH-like protein